MQDWRLILWVKVIRRREKVRDLEGVSVRPGLRKKRKRQLPESPSILYLNKLINNMGVKMGEQEHLPSHYLNQIIG